MIELETIKHKLNIYRRYPHWKKQGAIFIHVPKVAGTSINKAIYGRTLGHYTAVEIKNKFPNLYNESFVFSFVRNPWARVVSAYKFAKQGGTDSMKMNMPEQYRVPEFESFERFVKEWLVLQNINELDYVFKPQVHFLTDENGKVIVDFVNKLEDLEGGIAKLELELGKKIIVGRVNTTSAAASYRKEYANQELVNLVGDIYKNDIQTFGYDYPS